jgi:hypothetical protein
VHLEKKSKKTQKKIVHLTKKVVYLIGYQTIKYNEQSGSKLQNQF